MKRNDLPEWDDGRTIVNMDVEGMPWNNRPRSVRKLAHDYHQHKENAQSLPQDEMSRKEARFFTWGAVKAGLLIVGILSAALVLFILFCQNVWFR